MQKDKQKTAQLDSQGAHQIKDLSSIPAKNDAGKK